MTASTLHELAEKIGNGQPVTDDDLLKVLSRDGTIVMPRQGGGERLLPSGEILSVLADSAGLSIEQVLSRSFGMTPQEISVASEFIRLVQFAGDELPADAGISEQPFQPLDG